MNKFYKLFNDKAKLYATSRPGYSAHVLEYLKKDLEFTSAVKGADIGCGTGQLTQILAQYFNYKNISYIQQSAENTKIEEKSLDYAITAQAFHLFHNAETLKELKRILKPNGYFIIIYNMKNHFSDLFIKNEKVLLKYCPLYNRDFHATEFQKDSFRDCFTEESYHYFQNDNTEYLDSETFINRTLSASYAIQKDNPCFSDFTDELYSVFEEFSVNHKVKMELSTVIYSGHLR